ncbi:hypothetical protein PsYK624_164070 [Phanerochaete sordida]|uniref:Uncharacterized protein n=1 Tax=Phanerochaete sordida TaxID=48140 RepID=A0A9P3GQT8_9APHY|nr:hypothetical protein PsYK624_164070 [Phanerochaete sordida]
MPLMFRGLLCKGRLLPRSLAAAVTKHMLAGPLTLPTTFIRPSRFRQPRSLSARRWGKMILEPRFRRRDRRAEGGQMLMWAHRAFLFPWTALASAVDDTWRVRI